MTERKNKVTMSDIARKSGLSLSTVSLVLNDKPGLPTQTRAKVIRAAQELGYTMRSPEQATSKNNSLETIGLLVKRAEGDSTPPTSNIFFSHVISGVEAGCRQEGISMLMSTLPVDANNISLEIPAIIQDPRVNGLIFLGNYIDERLYAAVRQRAIPTVLVEAFCAKQDLDSVIIENAHGAYTAVKYLLDKGHRHIGFIGSYSDSRISFRYRRQGYIDALKDYGITKTYFADCPHNDHAAVIEATNRLLCENPQVTALFGCNDEVAVIAIHGANKCGRNVPGDVSIVGFDNNAIAEFSFPALTTVHVDKISLGRLAVQLIISRAENPSQGRVTMRVHTKLVERNSVRDIRGL